MSKRATKPFFRQPESLIFGVLMRFLFRQMRFFDQYTKSQSIKYLTLNRIFLSITKTSAFFHKKTRKHYDCAKFFRQPEKTIHKNKIIWNTK